MVDRTVYNDGQVFKQRFYLRGNWAAQALMAPFSWAELQP